mmetsp:Transcript_25112/g.58045  ORF Transcript_25112/g.58045 Transcript_25112/m.58045 type:complete len:292 (-) Transcript_25112:319-1194(-)|eukprot:CAMPEP_0113298298 /NCGR_PEP_ID=MMETSP0010_2-20120614/801_1 /TAXON_ID=216773 ORGANISM="Corethron hystrix, Strain 308" /NCGR_SAMPLE_ID=MMETSP0010_2 /ASSEMBLY_ACC=CAM_ASM_000155 /LENGTH=291 /DNA_ID=CAMNT_0000151329 /DNA_START=65 /DNA_END=940 /DNA_ORIENTATION=+ /assembly_acc=CAM_ASM_000155
MPTLPPPTDGPIPEDVVIVRRQKLPKSDREVVVITINRPKVLNCFNSDVIRGLSTAFRRVAEETSSDDPSDGPVAVILNGSGQCFCAGADLSDPPNPVAQSSDLPAHLENNPVHQMRRIHVPIIGAVHSYVITGGFELALACDILVGDMSTLFRDTHVKFGLAPCWGLSQKLARRIGPGRARWASLSATKIKADEAFHWGLLDLLIENKVGGAAVLDRALEMADDIGQNNMTMVKRYKRSIDEGTSRSLRDGLQRERELGISHYIETVYDGKTFQDAKSYISGDGRRRSKL